MSNVAGSFGCAACGEPDGECICDEGGVHFGCRSCELVWAPEISDDPTHCPGCGSLAIHELDVE